MTAPVALIDIVVPAFLLAGFIIHLLRIVAALAAGAWLVGWAFTAGRGGRSRC